MKVLFFVLASLLAAELAFAGPDITGEVTLPKDLEKVVTSTGVLFIIARAPGEAKPGMPPLAVLRIANPKFPQKFSIGAKNSMMGGAFEGLMSITARYTPNGNALDKSGPQGTDPKNPTVKPGKADVKIELAMPKTK